MRLLHFGAHGELSLTDFLGDIPPYAVLSHLRGYDEVLFEDIQSWSYKSSAGHAQPKSKLGSRGPNYKEKAGYAKIEFCGRQAQKDNLQYFWIDVCCIDRYNLVELSETLNSMNRWLRKATKCYVYLSAVSADPHNDDFRIDQKRRASIQSSKWFARVWTLQELLLPTTVEFFSREGQFLGDKTECDELIHQITGIPHAAIHGAPLSKYSIEERLQWMARRKATTVEDIAYCLLGILEVSMPILYGEGEQAFVRLQEAVENRSKSAHPS